MTYNKINWRGKYANENQFSDESNNGKIYLNVDLDQSRDL